MTIDAAPTRRIIDINGNVLKIEENGSMPVTLQDSTTPSVIWPANKVIVSSTLASAVAIDDRTCTVVSAAGMTVGDLLIVTSTIGDRYFKARITVIATNTLTLSVPFDYAFEAGQQASATTTNLAVDGSSTPQIFSLRAAEPVAGLNVTVDIVRIMMYCTTPSAVDLAKFGHLTALTNGLLLRRIDGTYQNIADYRSNGEIAGVMYDWAPYAATNPTQGQDGFAARLTFGSQGKMGTVHRVGPNEDIQGIVQDDLSTIIELQIIFEGSVAIVDE